MRIATCCWCWPSSTVAPSLHTRHIGRCLTRQSECRHEKIFKKFSIIHFLIYWRRLGSVVRHHQQSFLSLCRFSSKWKCVAHRRLSNPQRLSIPSTNSEPNKHSALIHFVFSSLCHFGHRWFASCRLELVLLRRTWFCCSLLSIDHSVNSSAIK